MKPIFMCLCEVEHVTLRLGRPYIFTEGESCSKCKTMADNARAAYGPKGGADAGDWRPGVTLELPEGDKRTAKVFWTDYDPDEDTVHVCISVDDSPAHTVAKMEAEIPDSPVDLWLIKEPQGRQYTVHRKALAYVLRETGCTVQPLGVV